MAHEIQISTASAADVAADMEYHRESWGRFVNIMKWTAIGAIVILVILFFIFD